ncbi:putative formin-like protein 6 isoform X1 [Iris pallida]|uniref:Formin-like protein 6 isoform X1 n=1 Tax=Iris pallida TaxID=29817 RepID=A0AAX6G562_IRIPA|nr:putative formin-like protein 6 isoform X1 [Iris pallida]
MRTRRLAVKEERARAGARIWRRADFVRPRRANVVDGSGGRRRGWRTRDRVQLRHTEGAVARRASPGLLGLDGRTISSDVAHSHVCWRRRERERRSSTLADGAASLGQPLGTDVDSMGCSEAVTAAPVADGRAQSNGADRGKRWRLGFDLFCSFYGRWCRVSRMWDTLE